MIFSDHRKSSKNTIDIEKVIKIKKILKIFQNYHTKRTTSKNQVDHMKVTEITDQNTN